MNLFTTLGLLQKEATVGDLFQGVTPFIIIYTADDNGVLEYKEYVSTGKAENTPSIRENMPRLDKYFK